MQGRAATGAAQLKCSLRFCSGTYRSLPAAGRKKPREGRKQVLQDHRTAALEPNPMHVYLEVSPIIVNETYSQENAEDISLRA